MTMLISLILAAIMEPLSGSSEPTTEAIALQVGGLQQQLEKH